MSHLRSRQRGAAKSALYTKPVISKHCASTTRGKFHSLAQGYDKEVLLIQHGGIKKNLQQKCKPQAAHVQLGVHIIHALWEFWAHKLI